MLVFIAYGEGECDVQLDKDTNSEVEGNYWHLLEVADLRFDLFFLFFFTGEK